MKKLALAIGVVALASAVACAAELPTAEDVLAKVTAAYGALKSFEADIRTTLETTEPVMEGIGHWAMERTEKNGETTEKVSLVQKLTVNQQRMDENRAIVRIKELTEQKVVSDGSFT